MPWKLAPLARGIVHALDCFSLQTLFSRDPIMPPVGAGSKENPIEVRSRACKAGRAG